MSFVFILLQTCILSQFILAFNFCPKYLIQKDYTFKNLDKLVLTSHRRTSIRTFIDSEDECSSKNIRASLSLILQLKVALSRLPPPWASLLCCIVTQINAFFHQTSQSTRCFQQKGDTHSSLTKATNLASKLRLISMECFSKSISRHFEALCSSASLKQPFLPFRRKAPGINLYLREKTSSRGTQKHV